MYVNVILTVNRNCRNEESINQILERATFKKNTIMMDSRAKRKIIMK